MYLRINAFAPSGRGGRVGAALGYVLLPLRGVPLVSFDTPSP